MAKTSPFYLVWNPMGSAPLRKHGNAQEAEREAERLSRNNPGQEFYVLAPITRMVRNDIVIERFQSDEIPF